MIAARGYAAQNATSPLQPFSFRRREPGDHDILFETLYCGICHSDIHQVRDEWGGSIFPMVPGHEIVGKVIRAGSKVTKFKAGDLAGVGCFVDSCGQCANCKEGLEQYCDKHLALTYNGTEMDETTPTYGGYSSNMVVNENYALKVSPKLDPKRAAPLLCAGITTYSPLRHWKVGKGQRVAIVGLGGLGHVAVKLAASMGADVTVLSTSASKEQDARQLGARDFIVTKNPGAFEANAGRFDFILDLASAPHDLNAYLGLLKRDGVMVLIGIPPKPAELSAGSLILRRRKLAGSVIGGIAETQEMLDYCAERGIMADVEVIPVEKINEAYERTIKGDVRYRFVIDLKSLK